MSLHALLMLFALACSSAPQVPNPELPAPWAELDLPIGAATVKKQGPDVIQVHYSDTEDVAEVLAGWAAALERKGFTVDNPHGSSGIAAMDAKRDSVKYTLLVSGKGKGVDAALMPD